MGHWIHHTRGGFFCARSATNGLSTVFPTQLREVTDNDHDAFNGVFILGR